MTQSRKIDWGQLRTEIRRRWAVLTFIAIYLVVGGLFALLIYQFGWDQLATRWAAQIYPLPAARVNGDTIWLSTYYRRLGIYEHYDQRVQLEQPDLLPNDPYERKVRVLDELVQIMLLQQAAQKVGITVNQADIDATYAKLAESNGGADNFEKVLADFYGITSVEFKREFIPEQLYRQKIQDQLFTQVHVRHIVLKDQAAAQQILDRVKAGENFEELAKNFSQDLSTRDRGGDLGWVRRGQLVKPFEDAAFALAAGATSENLVQTEFGFHILRVDERKDGQISDQSFTEWFNALQANAQVKRFVPKAPTSKSEPSPQGAESSSPEATPPSAGPTSTNS